MILIFLLLFIDMNESSRFDFKKNAVLYDLAFLFCFEQYNCNDSTKKFVINNM
jgi:hypothetical protein